MLPVTTAVSAAVVTLTARNGGASSDIDVRHSYRAGRFACRPVLASRLRPARRARQTRTFPTRSTSVTDELFNVIAHPYNVAATMATLEAELLARWGPTRQHDGVAFTGYRGTAAAATTYGNARNSPIFIRHERSLPSPSSIVEWAGGDRWRGGAVGRRRSGAALPDDTVARHSSRRRSARQVFFRRARDASV